jgi:hypothetical protein
MRVFWLLPLNRDTALSVGLVSITPVTSRRDQNFMSVHSIAEMYAALTLPPVQLRIHPVEAGRKVTDNVVSH